MTSLILFPLEYSSANGISDPGEILACQASVDSWEFSISAFIWPKGDDTGEFVPADQWSTRVTLKMIKHKSTFSLLKYLEILKFEPTSTKCFKRLVYTF